MQALLRRASYRQVVRFGLLIIIWPQLSRLVVNRLYLLIAIAGGYARRTAAPKTPRRELRNRVF